METPETIVREATLEEVIKIDTRIPEFGEYDLDDYKERIRGQKHLIAIAAVGDEPAGFIVSYDKFKDGSLYAWMGGVVPEFRRKGVYSALQAYRENWARKHGFDRIKIKTRNNRREQLANLVARGYFFTSVEPREDIEENRVSAELLL